MIPRSSVQEILQQIPILSSSTNLISSRFIRDLTLLGVLNNDLRLTELGNELVTSNEKKQEILLKKAALSLPKMVKIKELLNPTKRVTSKEIISKLPKDFFDGLQESSKVIYATKAMTWLK